MNLYNVEYLDPSQPYWSAYYIEKASVGGNLYTITGDLAISMIRLLGVTFFNKTTISDYGIGDLYSVVNGGTWTVDYELGLIKDIYNDLNGDGERDNGDLYGLGTSDTFSVDAYTSSFDLEILAKDENNYPYINVNLEKAASILETVYKLCWDTTGVNTYHFDTDDSEMTEIAKVFSENRFVLMSNWIYSTETSFPARDGVRLRYNSVSQVQRGTGKLLFLCKRSAFRIHHSENGDRPRRPPERCWRRCVRLAAILSSRLITRSP